jgi:hypothetical protein
MESRKLNWRLAILLAVTLALSACASVGPVESAQFQSLVSGCLPRGHGPVLFAAGATWVKSSYGYDKLPQAQDLESGALVLTDMRLYFLAWDEGNHKYTPVFMKDYSDIRSVALPTFGLGRRIAMQGKDLAFDSFEVLAANGATIDRGKTDEAYRILRAHIPNGANGGATYTERRRGDDASVGTSRPSGPVSGTLSGGAQRVSPSSNSNVILASLAPFTVGDARLKFVSAEYGSSTFAPADMGSRETVLTVVLKVLSGDPDVVSKCKGEFDVWTSDESGRRNSSRAATALVNGRGEILEIKWLFAVAKDARSLYLHFPGGTTIDLAPLIH